MKYVILSGGLGNQLWQLNFSKWLVKRGYKVRLVYAETAFMHSKNKSILEFINNEEFARYPRLVLFLLLLLKLFRSNLLSNDNSLFMGSVIYEGYWQSSRFGMNLGMNWSERRDGVAIHIRRGDYVSEKNIQRYGYLFTNGYFDKVLKLVENDIVHVFSDDLDWCRTIKKRIHFWLCGCLVRMIA